MPHYTFTAESVAEYLSLHPRDVEQLVKERDIPFETRGQQIVFRRRDIDAWASQKILGFNAHRLEEYHRQTTLRTRKLLQQATIFADMTRPEWIAPAMTSKTKASVVRDMAALADRTGLVCDMAELVTSLREREDLCPTAVEGGVAFLHPRNHDAYLVVSSFLILGRTIQPIHFGSADGHPTNLFFLLCCQDDKLHLHALARLCMMVQNTGLGAHLREAGDAVTMHEQLIAAEHAVVAPPGEETGHATI